MSPASARHSDGPDVDARVVRPDLEQECAGGPRYNRAISRQPATRSARRTSSTACSRRPPPANYRPWHPGLTVSVLLTFLYVVTYSHAEHL